MPLTIKFPTLITEPIANGLATQTDMITNAEGIFERYNNNPQGTVTIPTRGKTTEKVIKSVETSRMTFWQDLCLLIKVEEFKKGYNDLYLDKGMDNQQDISTNDKIGSRFNYAMMYPYIMFDNNGDAINRWVVFIYAAADKTDSDLINTIKIVISKVLNLHFLNVINRGLQNGQSFPWVSVNLTRAENIDNQNIELNQYVVTAKAKSIQELWYQDIPVNEAETLRNGNDINNGWKKILKFFTSKDKKSYLKYEYERDGQGTLSTKLMEKYSYSKDIDNVDEMYDPHFMEQCFLEVLNRFLSNE